MTVSRPLAGVASSPPPTRIGPRRGALAELCAAYWFPVYALIRRKGHDPDSALDLTQDYFARLLEKPVLAAADPRKGRFRLPADGLRPLPGQRHDRAARLKRGGGRTFVPIESARPKGDTAPSRPTT